MEKSYVRRLDGLRRVVIPIEIYRELEFQDWQEVEITIEYGKICVKKYEHQDIKQVPYIGMVRRLDNLHRIVIPIEYMMVCKIEENTDLKFLLIGEKIEISID